MYCGRGLCCSFPRSPGATVTKCPLGAEELLYHITNNEVDLNHETKVGARNGQLPPDRATLWSLGTQGQKSL